MARNLITRTVTTTSITALVADKAAAELRLDPIGLQQLQLHDLRQDFRVLACQQAVKGRQDQMVVLAHRLVFNRRVIQQVKNKRSVGIDQQVAKELVVLDQVLVGSELADAPPLGQDGKATLRKG